jgi:hypothetical protein
MNLAHPIPIDNLIMRVIPDPYASPLYRPNLIFRYVDYLMMTRTEVPLEQRVPGLGSRHRVGSNKNFWQAIRMFHFTMSPKFWLLGRACLVSSNAELIASVLFRPIHLRDIILGHAFR